MEIISASNQKINKISVNSNESGDYLTDFPLQNMGRYSVIYEDIEEMTILLKSSLGCAVDSIDLPKGSIDLLKTLVKTICSEFNSQCMRFNEINLKNYQSKTEDISVSLLKVSQKDVLGHIFSFPDTGVYLTKDQCQRFSALIIGALRDSASHGLKKKNKELQEKFITLAGLNNQMKAELRQKNEEIGNLLYQLKGLQNKAQNNSMSKAEDLTKSNENSVDKIE